MAAVSTHGTAEVYKRCFHEDTLVDRENFRWGTEKSPTNGRIINQHVTPDFIATYDRGSFREGRKDAFVDLWVQKFSRVREIPEILPGTTRLFSFPHCQLAEKFPAYKQALEKMLGEDEIKERFRAYSKDADLWDEFESSPRKALYSMTAHNVTEYVIRISEEEATVDVEVETCCMERKLTLNKTAWINAEIDRTLRVKRNSNRNEPLRLKLDTVENFHVFREIVYKSGCNMFLYENIQDPREHYRMDRFSLRPYQNEVKDTLFVNDESGLGRYYKSGVVTLPCGAGKTAIATYCASELGGMLFVTPIKSTTQQIRAEIEKNTTFGQNLVHEDGAYVIKDSVIVLGDELESAQRQLAANIDYAQVVVATTHNLKTIRDKSEDTRNDMYQRIYQSILRKNWKVVVIDEIHRTYNETKRIIQELTARNSYLGITATLIKESSQQNYAEDTYSKFGHTAHVLCSCKWRKLEQGQYLSTPLCIDVHVDLDGDLKCFIDRLKNLKVPGVWSVTGFNLSGLKASFAIALFQQRMGNKTILMHQYLYSGGIVKDVLGIPFVSGEDDKSGDKSNSERIVQLFNTDPMVSFLNVSSTGDIGVDTKAASVAIQVTFMHGSRGQESQRLGRILRRRPQNRQGSHTSLFTTIVNRFPESSDDTGQNNWVEKVRKRHMYLEAQGYRFVATQGIPYKTYLNDSINERILHSRRRNLFKKYSVDSLINYFKGKGVTQKREYSENLVRGGFAAVAVFYDEHVKHCRCDEEALRKTLFVLFLLPYIDHEKSWNMLRQPSRDALVAFSKEALGDVYNFDPSCVWNVKRYHIRRRVQHKADDLREWITKKDPSPPKE